jgi:hypothetical protein
VRDRPRRLTGGGAVGLRDHGFRAHVAPVYDRVAAADSPVPPPPSGRLPPVAVELREFSWDRMVEAVQAVRERALRATAALERAGIPYAMAGGNAVAAWVARVDRAAVRNTQDVDILVRRSDLAAVTTALEGAGFVRATVMDVVCFIDGPQGSPRDAVHLLFAGEKVRESYPLPTADVTERVAADDYAIVSLEALVRMKLNSFRRKDQVHLLDLLSLGLVDAGWMSRLVPEHAARLRQLIDDPDG